MARGRPGRIGGWLAFAAFVVYAGVTAASTLWSVDPDLTWVEANRTLAYLAVFAAALTSAHLAPQGWAVLLRGILIGAFAVCCYGLVSRVFPGLARVDRDLRAPRGALWLLNALGATVALAVPPALWLGSRRSGHAAVNALAYPSSGSTSWRSS